jgi:hypothetical protein
MQTLIVESAPQATIDPVSFLDLPRAAKDGVPNVAWLLDGWLAVGDIALVGGNAGIGKSTTIGALAVSLASGRPWCGLTPTRTGPVLVFDEEQGEADVVRMYLRLGGHEAPNLRVASAQGMRLDSPEGIGRLNQTLGDANPIAVVFDSVQQVIGDVDENNASEVAACFRSLFALRDRYQTSFILIHHARKPMLPGRHGGERIHTVRGSTAWTTQPSTVWQATSEASDTLDLTQIKRRGSARLTLRTSYREDESNQITIDGIGVVPDEGALEEAQVFIVNYLGVRPASKTRDLVQAGVEGGHPERTMKRALDNLLKISRVERPVRGTYRLVQSAPEPPEMEFG